MNFLQRAPVAEKSKKSLLTKPTEPSASEPIIGDGVRSSRDKPM